MDEAAMRIRAGVTDLMMTYTFLADAGRIRQLSALFTADAVFETNTGRHIGPEGVLDFFRSVKDGFIAAAFAPSRHHVSSIHVEPREDGGATTYACFNYIGARGPDHWGVYRDEVVAVDGGWRFARRSAIVEGCVPASPVVALLGLEAAS